ncbi:MAG: hypothetical protein H7Y03_02325 [Chitinophagaceae bacterium]|nr:hypothetical protein [Chitinophagaceae bacterium]
MISILLKRAFSLLLVVLFAMTSAAQEQLTKFDVFHNGNMVGIAQLYQKRSGDGLYMKMTTDIKVRMMMEISVKIIEESRFVQGKLIHSQLNRTVNGKEKANRQTNAIVNGYQTIAEGKQGTISQPRIDYNLIQMYQTEPVNRSRVYSDNFQTFLTITQLPGHVYRINLPDGNYNEFTYSKGVCTRVSINSSMYTIQLKRV